MRAWLCAALACACAEPAPRPVPPPVTVSSVAPTAQAPRPTKPAGAESFEATLRIEPQPGGKRFQGVWLERADGEKWVISYRADPWWRPFENRRVRVEGESYEPEGQAVMAHHFRPRVVSVLDPKAEPMPMLIEVHEERSVRGRFRVHTWPAGTKLEGESQTVFEADDGESYSLANTPERPPPNGVTVQISAREVVPSPYVTRPGGRSLWIISVHEP